MAKKSIHHKYILLFVIITSHIFSMNHNKYGIQIYVKFMLTYSCTPSLFKNEMVETATKAICLSAGKSFHMYQKQNKFHL